MIKAYDVELPWTKGNTGDHITDADIREFLNSDHNVAELEINPNVKATYYRYYSFIRNKGLAGTVKVIRRASRIFLVKQKGEQNNA